MNILVKLTVPLLASAALMTMCSNQTNNKEMPASKAAIEAQWEVFIKHWEAEASTDLVKIYTADAVNIPPGGTPMNGRAEIQAFYDLLFDSNASSNYNHSIQEIHFSGNSATEYGKFKVDWERNDGSTWTFHARSMTYWVKSDKGWQIKMFMFNNPPTEE